MSSVNTNSPNDPTLLNQQLLQEEILQEDIKKEELNQDLVNQQLLASSQNGTTVAPNLNSTTPLTPEVEPTQQRKMRRLGHHVHKV